MPRRPTIFTLPCSKTAQGYQVRPAFDGMLLAAQLKTGTLLETSVQPQAGLAAYANRGPCLQMVLINRDLHEAARDQADAP